MDQLADAVFTALKYVDSHGVEVPPLLRVRLNRFAEKAAKNITEVNRRYHDNITQALIDYFEGGNVVSRRNLYKREMVTAFGSAFDMGWRDGGGEGTPQGEALDWFNARVDREFANIDSLFLQAKELKKEDDFDFFSWVTARADGYTSSVGAVYNAGRMYAMKGKLLTWHLGRTEKHCDTCSSLNGGRHRASWYLARNYIPREPGASMDCGGYRCDCRLVDNDGKEVSI